MGISHRLHLQPMTGVVNPAMMVPRDGPASEEMAHVNREYGLLYRSAMSVKEAPPVLNMGDANRPCKNRRKRSPHMFFAKAVGIEIIMNNVIPRTYGMLRPIDGISDRGDQSIRPIP